MFLLALKGLTSIFGRKKSLVTEGTPHKMKKHDSYVSLFMVTHPHPLTPHHTLTHTHTHTHSHTNVVDNRKESPRPQLLSKTTEQAESGEQGCLSSRDHMNLLQVQ